MHEILKEAHGAMTVALRHLADAQMQAASENPSGRLLAAVSAANTSSVHLQRALVALGMPMNPPDPVDVAIEQAE